MPASGAVAATLTRFGAAIAAGYTGRLSMSRAALPAETTTSAFAAPAAAIAASMFGSGSSPWMLALITRAPLAAA